MFWDPSSSDGDSDGEASTHSFSGINTDGTVVDASIPESPNFNLGNFFGDLGSIQRIKNHLIVTIPGDEQVLIFVKNTSTGLFGSPTTLNLPDDSTFPTSARFDPFTFDEINEDYDLIYVSLSDLRRDSTDATGLSRVIKMRVKGSV